MDRVGWLKQRRLWNEVQMDTIYARQYDERWGASINDTRRQMVERVLSLCPSHAHILDAACGAGKYWTLLLTEGRTVVGTDQSRGMLERAHACLSTLWAHLGPRRERRRDPAGAWLGAGEGAGTLAAGRR